jgi:hypothetical protein
LQEKQLKLWGDTEKDIYKKLKTQRFVLTPRRFSSRGLNRTMLQQREMEDRPPRR